MPGVRPHEKLSDEVLDVLQNSLLFLRATANSG
jgi:hypothetical protein